MKNYLKKFLILCLILSISLSFAACNDNTNINNDLSSIEDSNEEDDKSIEHPNNQGNGIYPYKTDTYQEHPDNYEIDIP